MYTVEQARAMLEEIGTKDPPRFQAAMATLLIDVIEAHGTTLKGARVLANEMKSFREFLQAAAGRVQQQAAEDPGVPVVGADGSPLDATQAAAEAAMNEAAGPRIGEGGPPPAPGNGGGGPPLARAVPPRGGVRVGAGAAPPVTGDPVQDEAERAMDEAAGPRA